MGQFRLLLATVGTISGFTVYHRYFSLSGFSIAFLKVPLMIKFSATLLATLIAASVNAATVDLRIMETTDLHSNMMDFDYYKDTATENSGLVRTASLIHAARNEVKTACWWITAT